MFQIGPYISKTFFKVSVEISMISTFNKGPFANYVDNGGGGGGQAADHVCSRGEWGGGRACGQGKGHMKIFKKNVSCIF